jgi:drug/metabolite transporter (DMT)-like permease
MEPPAEGRVDLVRRGLSPRVSDGARGIVYIAIAVFLFGAFNTVMKAFADDFPPTQLIFFRGLFGLLPLFVLLALDERRFANLRSANPRLQVARALSAFIANVLVVVSYQFMPLADAVAIAYAAPIFVTALSVPLLGERVGVHRWSAVLVGFLGVLLVAQPDSGVVDVGAIFAVAGTFSYALCNITTRRLGAVDAPMTTMLWSTMLYTAFGALTLPWAWTTPTPAQIPGLMAMGCIATGGMFFYVRAYKYAEAGKLAPFDYTAMGWAALFGFLVWGEIPQLMTWLGIAVIALSGLYIVHRETVRRRGAAT